MILKRVFLLVWLVFVVALLCTTTIAGLFDVSDNVSIANTPLRQLALTFQVLYVVSGAVAVVGLLAKRAWRVRALAAWAATVTVAAALAPPAWGDTGIGPALAAGAATLLVTGLVAWWTHRLVGQSP